MTRPRCPDRDALVAFVAGKVDETIRAHLRECPVCRGVVAGLRGSVQLAGLMLEEAPRTRGDMPPGMVERLFRKVNPVWEAGSVPAIPRLAAQTDPPPAAQDEQTAAVHCLFVDPDAGTGHVRPLFVRLGAGGAEGIHPRVDCDEQMRAAVDRAIRAALTVLARLGFDEAARVRPAGDWWIEGARARYEGASVGLGAALAAAAAYSRVRLDSQLIVTGMLQGERVTSVASVASKWRALQGKGFETFLLPANDLHALPPEARQASSPRLVGVSNLEDAVAAALGKALGLARRDVATVITQEAPARARVKVEVKVEPTRRRTAVRTRGVGVRPAAPLRVGDEIQVLVRSSHDCHVSLVNLGSAGDVTVLVPNDYHTQTQVRAGEWHAFPGETGGFHLPLLGPPGREKVIALASEQPLRLLPENFAQRGQFAAVSAAGQDVGVMTDAMRGRVQGVAEVEFTVEGPQGGAAAADSAAPAVRALDLVEEPRRMSPQEMEAQRNAALGGREGVAELSVEALRSEGVLEELAKVFSDPDAITELLHDIRFPITRRQFFAAGQTPQSYWEWLCQEVEAGVIEGGLEALLAAAGKRYPGNPVFRRLASRRGQG